ncbi:MAG: hypothetical protein EOP48_30175 [Sphingobacteriales bacterium]|nr:MAG: hypothetical protein EOP48_30175 [Sphingobacteriales bacterium]
MIVDTEPILLQRNQNIIELPPQLIIVNDDPVFDDNLHHDDDSDEESYEENYDDSDEDSYNSDEYSVRQLNRFTLIFQNNPRCRTVPTQPLTNAVGL